MSKPLKNHIQGPTSHSTGGWEYSRLQELILFKTKVACTVLVTPGVISLRCANYADFVLAKGAIKNEAGSRQIVQSS